MPGCTTSLPLPRIYAITPEPSGTQSEYLARIMANLTKHAIDLVQFRAKSLSPEQYKQYASALLDMARLHDIAVMLNAEPTLAQELGAAGVHLPQQKLMARAERPNLPGLLIAASCHDAQSLHHASNLGLDFAVLSPVKITTSHPQAAPLGWQRFGQLAAQAAMPVYALGGVGWEDLDDALQHHAQGVAGISMWCGRGARD